ncbi:hypothetical protein B9Z19DRAFT_1061702 [Tuber borchii]|uniref:Kelch repeat protein n=1 Tax=Tuber borchii TaxID=42251 RepID=A0A2T7A4I2_TUBBO|nr:hypothetical protein B9Z19DRAFT_1061702 [Tuber borchii]
MARYPLLVTGSLLWLSGLVATVVNSTIYTIGGTAYYWTPKYTPGYQNADNNYSVYILKTSNSFLRALDLSKPVDFGAEFSDTADVISELPFEIPHVKLGAVWADQNKIYYWGGELEVEPVYMNGAFQNKTREWPDPMKYYTYDLSQPKGSGEWQTVSISMARGSDVLTVSPSFGSYTYSAEARKAFYLGGMFRRNELNNTDGSNATRAGIEPYYVGSMVVYDAVQNVWDNDTIATAMELNDVVDGAMVYVAGVGEKGILVRIGGIYTNGDLLSFDTVYVYDIAANIWHRQPTTSKTNIFPESRWGGFCAGAIAASDKTSFTIYIYGGYAHGQKKGTWALTMPYFQWIPVGSSGEPELGHSSTTCQVVGGTLVMVRGRGVWIHRGDTNGGSYFYDMTNLTWSFKYQPSEYQVPKTISDVIGGNGQGHATITGPTDDKSFAEGLGRLFTAAAANATRSTGSGSTGYSKGGSSNSTGAIAGGVVGGVAGLAIIWAGIWVLMGTHKGPPAPNYQEGWLARQEIDSVPIQIPVHELDNTVVQGGTHQ